MKRQRWLLVLAALLVLSTGAFGQTTKHAKVQKVTIRLTESGYKPSEFKLRRGIRASVTFIRKTDRTCGQQIVIPAYGIHRELPLNRPVTVSFTPRRTGTFNFACGMDMLRGKIIVN